MSDTHSLLLKQLNGLCKNTLMERLCIEFTEVGANYLCAKMPVNSYTMQSMGFLHGGASVALAESVGGAASALYVDFNEYDVMGIEVNANHVKGVKSSYVYAKATAIHIGTITHVWEIRITDEEKNLISVCRLTNIVKKKNI